MTALVTRNHEQLAAAGVLTSTGLAGTLTIEEAKLLVPYTATVASASRWWRADLAVILGNTCYEEIANTFGVSPVTVQQDAATAKAWPFEMRVPDVSFNHHRILNRYVESMGFDMLRDVLQDVAAAGYTVSPESMLTSLLNTVSEPRPRSHQPRYREFETWLTDVTGLECSASNNTLWIVTGTGKWVARAVIDGGKPVIDWRFEDND